MATKKTPSSNYQVGLGASFLNRARWIFFILLFFAFNITVATIYVGANSGQLEEKITTPLAAFWQDMKDSMQESSYEYEPIDTPKTTTTSHSETNVEINTSIKTSDTPVVQYSYPTATPRPTTAPHTPPDYEIHTNTSPPDWFIESQQESDEQIQQIRDDNQAEFDAFKQESEASFEEAKALSSKCFDEFKENGEYVSDECINR